MSEKKFKKWDEVYYRGKKYMITFIGRSPKNMKPIAWLEGKTGYVFLEELKNASPEEI